MRFWIGTLLVLALAMLGFADEAKKPDVPGPDMLKLSLSMLQKTDADLVKAKDAMQQKALESQNAIIQFLQLETRMGQVKAQAQAHCKGELKNEDQVWKCEAKPVPAPVVSKK